MINHTLASLNSRAASSSSSGSRRVLTSTCTSRKPKNLIVSTALVPSGFLAL